VMPVISSRI